MPASKSWTTRRRRGLTCFGWAPGSGHESCRAVVTTAQVPINKFCLWYAFEKTTTATTTETTWTIKREPLFTRNPLAVSSDCCWCSAVVGQRCMHELFKEKDIKSKYTHTHTRTCTLAHPEHVCAYISIYFLCASHLILLFLLPTKDDDAPE